MAAAFPRADCSTSDTSLTYWHGCSVHINSDSGTQQGLFNPELICLTVHGSEDVERWREGIFCQEILQGWDGDVPAGEQEGAQPDVEYQDWALGNPQKKRTKPH